MSTKSICCVLVTLALLASNTALVMARASYEQFAIGYLMRSDEPHYFPARNYAGVQLRSPRWPVNGVNLALMEASVLGRSIRVDLVLREVAVQAGEDVVSRIRQAMEAGIYAFILDLPLEETIQLSRQLAGEEVLLFNPRDPDNRLRTEWCASTFYHTLPSDAMLSDSLAQFLGSRDWRRALVLQGAHPRDVQVEDSFSHSAAKRRHIRRGRTPVCTEQ